MHMWKLNLWSIGAHSICLNKYVAIVLKKLTVDKAKRHFIKHHERSQERARKASAEMSALRGTKPI